MTEQLTFTFLKLNSYEPSTEWEIVVVEHNNTFESRSVYDFLVKNPQETKFLQKYFQNKNQVTYIIDSV